MFFVGSLLIKAVCSITHKSDSQQRDRNYLVSLVEIAEIKNIISWDCHNRIELHILIQFVQHSMTISRVTVFWMVNFMIYLGRLNRKHIRICITLSEMYQIRKHLFYRDHKYICCQHLFIYIYIYNYLRVRIHAGDGVWNHWRLDCLLNHLFRRRWKKKHQSSASLASVREIHWCSVNSPHKGPVTRKMFPSDDVIMPLWSSSKYPTNRLMCILLKFS